MSDWTHIALDRRSPAYWRVTFDRLPQRYLTGSAGRTLAARRGGRLTTSG